jgi:hypothetical protein
MALKVNFSQSTLQQDVIRQTDNLHKRMINAYHMAGLKFVKAAREQIQSHSMGTYNDRTTNLRNSVGYYIFDHGRLVESAGFRGDIESTEGFEGGLENIQSFISDTGIQLIGVAGMNYASYVEAKGYNVISSQADVCAVDLAIYLERLGAVEHGTAYGLEETFNV